MLLPVFGLVFFGGVEGVFGDYFSGVSVDDDGVVGVDEDEDGLVFVGSADAEVEEFAAVAQGGVSGGVDFVVSDSPDLVEQFHDGFGFG